MLKANRIQYIVIRHNLDDFSMLIVRDRSQHRYSLDSLGANNMHDRLTALGFKAGVYFAYSGAVITYQYRAIGGL